MNIPKLFLYFITTLFSNFTFAQINDNTFLFADSSKIERINGIKYFEIFKDNSNTISISEIKKQKFIPCIQEIPNLGVTSSSFWIKLHIKNTTSSNNILLEIAQPTIDEIEFYTVDFKGEIKHIQSGEQIPFYNKKYKYPNFIFDIHLPTGETNTFYIKVKSGEQIMLPISIGPAQLIHESNATKDTLFGVYFGIILVMILYNFFIYLTIKDKMYLLYVIYIIFIGLTQLSLQGYTYKYLWPNYPIFANKSVYILTSITSIVAIPFLRTFLKTKEYLPKLNRVLDIFIFLFLCCIALAFLNFHNTSFQLMQLNTMLLSLYLLFIGFKINNAGYRIARFFLAAWSIFLIGVFIFILKDFGILPYNEFTFYMMPAGSAIETILLSFALADRIKILQKEKLESQTLALEALIENKRIITEQNIVLETKVEERTSALTKSNTELNLTLTELKQTQSQLVNAEKMASLGQLTAGIAHEINNPINFVVANIKPLKRDIEEIKELISKYQILNIKENSIEEKLNQIKNFEKEIDYNYLKQEIENILRGIEDGANRTADIVKGLRIFSRLDESVLKKANLIEGIDSTLTLLNSEINNANIDTTKNYSTLPLIECYPGKLNQVFMNIFNNAIFAIKENTSRIERGKLTITTNSNEKYISISIKDNGIGMTNDIKAKIFEPFYTTKAVGKGTGLGMSIAFSIIKDHNGEIEVLTEPGIGSEFIIRLKITP